jgi:pyrophosphatase PpaX
LIRGVLFDLDNTLVESVETIWRCADHVLRAEGLSGIDRRTAEKAMGLTIFDLFDLAEPNLTQAKKKKLFIEYKRCYADFMHYTVVLPNAKDAINYVKSCGLRIGLVTTKSRENTEKVLRAFGLREFFEALVGFEDTVQHKPSSQPIVKAASLLGLRPGEFAVVGDTEMDAIAGRGAGAVTIIVTTGVTPREKIIQAKPDFIIEGLGDLPKIVEELCRQEGDKKV